MSPAAAEAGAIRIGCSGWDYTGWRGPVYPQDLPRRDWFDHYTSLFDTVELNATHYRLPAATTVEGWRHRAPPGFVYAVKLGAFGSHRKKLRDPAEWLPNHFDRVDRLGEHLGPNLVQLPPRWKRNVERLEEFLVAAGPRHRWAIEVRDPSWLHDDTFAALHRHGAALVIHDLLPDHPWERTADWAYLRFHGPDAVNQAYRGGYPHRRLRVHADLIARWAEAGFDVYAYFNNDEAGHAVEDALVLRAETLI